jgi:hypothetical protein
MGAAVIRTTALRLKYKEVSAGEALQGRDHMLCYTLA